MAEQRPIAYAEPSKNRHDLVFIGTEVSLRTLPEYLKDGKTLNEFLDRFPEVTRERAVAFLEEPAIATSEVNVVKKYETVVTTGMLALRALMTLNGGATIAFLTFIGHLGEGSGASLARANTGELLSALHYFVFGTFYAVLGFGTIFLTNTSSYAESKHGFLRNTKWKPSNWLFFVTILCGVASIVYFLVASRSAVAGFQSVTGAPPIR
jgi:uncharacterized protein (DUF433 family)